MITVGQISDPLIVKAVSSSGIVTLGGTLPAQPHEAGVMSVLINPNIATVQTSAGENGRLRCLLRQE